MTLLTQRGFEREFKFKASKSSGKGGQHVNKVMTKIELVFNVPGSQVLTADEKILVQEKLASRLSSKGDLRIEAQTTRSQLKNKEISITRFYHLLEKALKKPKVRKATKPTKSSVQHRHKAKIRTSEIKQQRKKINPRFAGGE
ncbi:MAG: alternative ribosome rescue aminoacyl-tRNA hydrolase ArfB [Chitinophagales bacterium]|nr:alternative ribosome rescue aminoacyl-tRNA hydrolase ArfB [Chitinophagales bacterium]